MDEDQIEIKNELIDAQDELQIKDELNDQGFILSAKENIDLRNCDKIIQRTELNPKQFVKYESITIHSYSNSNGVPNQKLINLPSKNVQEKITKKSEVNSQKLIKSFLQTDQGMVLIGKSTFPDLLPSATMNKTSTKTLIQMKTEPETVEESGIFVKSEPDIKPEIFIGMSESDLSQEMSSVSDDPLKISVDEEKKQHVSSVHEGKNPEILPNQPNRALFSCFCCSKIFKSQAQCKMHISADHGGRKLDYKCQICSYLFSKLTALKEHAERFHKGKTVESIHEKCLFCSRLFLNQSALKEHVERFHRGKIIHQQNTSEIKKNFSCPICLKVFQTELDFKGHITSVHGEKVLEFSKVFQNTGGLKQSFLCNICSKIFQKKYDLDSHIVSIHRGKIPNKIPEFDTNSYENKKEFQCSVCLKSFKTKSYLKHHVSRVHEEKNPESPPKTSKLMFSCFICSKVFQSRADLKMHISMVHPFRCDVCSKVFQSEAEVKIHNSTDHGIKESIKQVDEKNKPLQCPFCPSKFSYRIEYDKHHSKVHEGKGPAVEKKLRHPKRFPCHLCSKVFQTKYDCQRHIFKVHEGKKPEQDDQRNYKFQCSICLIPFKSEHQVTKHVSRLHEGKQPEVIQNKLSKYDEDQDWSPSTSKNEKKMSKVHENEKFMCSICFKVLGAETALHRHMSQVHEKNKPIQCPHCPKKFGFKGEFNKHYINVHGGTELNSKNRFHCSICLLCFKSKNQFTQHVSRVHEGENPEVIQNEQSKYDEWSPHTKKSEKKIEKFTCSICFKSLGAKATLKRHMYNIHEKNTSFGFKKDSEMHFEKVHERIEIDSQDTNDGNDLNGHQDNTEIILPD